MSRMRPPPIVRSSRTAIDDSRRGETNRNHDRVERSRTWLSTSVRILPLFALVLVAVFIVADTAGHNLAVSDPDRALLVAPWEPIALNELAERQLTNTSGDSGDISSVENLARRALLFDPLDSRALSFLG